MARSQGTIRRKRTAEIQPFPESDLGRNPGFLHTVTLPNCDAIPRANGIEDIRAVRPEQASWRDDNLELENISQRGDQNTSFIAYCLSMP
jgi:hypothetical protein